jgi:hypothetical protein
MKRNPQDARRFPLIRHGPGDEVRASASRIVTCSLRVLRKNEIQVSTVL